MKPLNSKENKDILKYIEDDEFLSLYIDRNNIDVINKLKSSIGYQAWALGKAWEEVGKAMTGTKEFKFLQQICYKLIDKKKKVEKDTFVK